MTDSHVMAENGCSVAAVECPNGCREELTRKDVQVHVDTICRLREVECEYCHQRGRYESIINGHYDQCLEIPIPCTNDCGKFVTRRTLQAHLENECSALCPFHRAGCSAIVAYKDLETHTASCLNKYLPKAFLLLQKEMGSLKSQLQSVQEESKTQKSQLQLIREENKTLKGELSKTKNDLTDAQKKHERRTEVISTTLSTELDFMRSSHAHATQAETLALECLKTRLGSDVVHLKRDEALATFRMSNYAEHKETGRVWYTPPFFIGNGYKMCLTVHVKGFGVGKGTHLSVCLHQLAGEYDSQLKWPLLFNEMMEVTLLQQQCEGSKQSWLSKALRSPEPARKRSHSPEPLRRILSSELETKDTKSNGRPRHHVRHKTAPLQLETRDATSDYLSRRRKHSKSLYQKLPSELETKDAKSKHLPRYYSPQLTKRNLHVHIIEPPGSPLFSESHSEPMHISTLMHRVTSSSLPVGPKVGSLELFCLRGVVERMVYRDTLVFQCAVKCSNRTASAMQDVLDTIQAEAGTSSD